MVIEKKPKVWWIGAHDPSISEPRLRAKECYFYKKCIFGPMTLKIGDFVLIASAGSVDSDSIDGCEIAKIIHLFEVENDPQCKEPYQAIVQWYSRPYKIPHQLYDDDTIHIDFNSEIIEDYRPYDPIIDIETIFRKCTVILGDPMDSAAALMPKKSRLFSTFVCRYKIKKIRGIYRLIPLNDTSGDNRTPKHNQIRDTPKSSSKKRCTSKKTQMEQVEFIDVNDLINTDEPPSKSIVSPIKIVRNSVVKISRTSFEKQATKTPGKMEMNANYLLESPDINRTKANSASKLNGARRNLNVSLEANSTADSDMLNYSIIANSPSQITSDLKIKLRLSGSQKELLPDLEAELSLTNPPARKSRRTSIDTMAKINGALSRSSRKRSICEDVEKTPKRKDVRENADNCTTPSAKICDTPRRKSILKTPSGRQSLAGTPKRNIQLSNIVEEVIFKGNSSLAESNKTNTPRRSRKIDYSDSDDTDYVCDEPKTSKRKSAASATTPSSKSNKMTPTQKMKLIRSGAITPTIEARDKSSKRRKSDLQVARERLHVSAVPKSLPCREQEFENIYSFLEGKIQDQCGGCMYISGVPGTGKTATVTGVIRSLKHDNELEFDFIEINGMRLTEPRQAYVQIYKQLTGKTVSWEHAQSLLEKRFTTAGPRRLTTVLLVDELDILCNRRQDVVYNLLDWPTKSTSRLIVVTIANTMDLPERMLMSKVTSRLGLTRLTFQPYSHTQLQEIVTARLCGSEAFKSDAVQLVARKVAAVSGDARRALDICRRATEIAEESTKERTVSMTHVQQALGEMISSAKVQAIKNCSKLEQLFLQSVAAEVARTGVDETTFLGVYTQMETISAFMGASVPVPGRALKICAKLGAERLLICEHSRTDIFQKIILNVSTDDIHYALQLQNN